MKHSVFGLVTGTHRRKIWKGFLLATTLTGLLFFYYCLPDPLFSSPFSLVLLDRRGDLLGAHLARDEQWRFPRPGEVPEKFVHAITAFEDKRFFFHPGFDPFAMGRALWMNIRHREIRSGGSTLTMQTIRLARKRKPRTVLEKCIEVVLSLRLEISRSKSEIMSLYAAHAPFGGNVVGLEAAAWRYFGRHAGSLTWAEATTLAVLPNSPGLIHPGRNRAALHRKRDWLLKKLWQSGKMDSLDYSLAMAEPLPGKPLPLPRHAPHLLVKMQKTIMDGNDMASSSVRTTMDRSFQVRATEILQSHVDGLKGNGIHNGAALILNIKSNQVLAYVGNSRADGSGTHGNNVDIIAAPRSTGSVLKPFLFASAIQDGQILPTSLVADVPMSIQDFSPKNYSRGYEGAVPAKMALARSLNVPAVRLLWQYGVGRFHHVLRGMGMNTLVKGPEHYGLTLILGGAEGTVWDLTAMYAGMARTVNAYFEDGDGPDHNKYFLSPRLRMGQNPPVGAHDNDPYLGAAACWQTLEAMVEVTRPNEESAWRNFTSSRKIAWKTGTSYGFRDGWAIGCTPRYAVGVWVGNADGEGRPGLTGIGTAAPIMFDLFSTLPGSEWFDEPEAEMSQLEICTKSGFRSNSDCAIRRQIRVPRQGTLSRSCPYCRTIHLDSTASWRVNARCESVTRMQNRPWFVLPPAMEWFYRKKHTDYAPVPAMRMDCRLSGSSEKPFDLLYPEKGTAVYVPVGLDGVRGNAVFEATHRRSGATIFWHLDHTYLGSTTDFHQMAICPGPGTHKIVLVDENGNRIIRSFRVLSKD